MDNLYLELSEERFQSSLELYPVKATRSNSTDGTVLSSGGTVSTEFSHDSKKNKPKQEKPFLFIDGHYQPANDEKKVEHVDNNFVSSQGPCRNSAIPRKTSFVTSWRDRTTKNRLSRLRKSDSVALQKAHYSIVSFGVPHFLLRLKPFQALEEARKKVVNNRRRKNMLHEGIDQHILGNVAAAENDWVRALDCYRQALACFVEHFGGSEDIAVAKTHQKIGTAYYALGRLHMSHDSFVEALRIEEAILDEPGDERFTLVLKNLYVVRWEMKQQMRS